MRNGEIVRGLIANMCYAEPIPFRGLDQLLLTIDGMCEVVRFPAANTKTRFLSERAVRALPKPMFQVGRNWRDPRPPEQWRQPSAAGPMSVRQEGEISGEAFLIHVVYRQNSSMQGYLIREAKNGGTAEKECFRSGLELLHMLDSCLNAPPGI